MRHHCPGSGPSPHHATKNRPLPPQLGAMETAVAAAFAVAPSALRARTRRSAAAALARQTAMYLAHVALGLSLTKVGKVFGRDRTTAAHACRRMEDRREDPRLDSLLASLEQACRSTECDRAHDRVRQ